ncbi:MAG TPA: DMT family transporter [Pyrinomonadaceae bacterium]|nr:DMT family transporter [Pyrinomonadaceae bacterium]
MRTFLLTSCALVAFAMNSVLCRLALGHSAIDAASFSTVRLASGAVMLLLITAASKKSLSFARRSNWVSAALLFLYAVAFSLAYINLSAGTGALILFGSVQATMLTVALLSGERPHLFEWSGLFLALAGLIYLVLPGLAAPSFASSLLMAAAGISWGFYSLRGRGTRDPLADTTNNFLRALPLAVVVSIVMKGFFHLSSTGIIFAVLSGAITSGLGYVIWYAALKGLTATRAAMVQLAVPILAAAGGVMILSEKISLRLLLSAVLVLGGVGLALMSRKYWIRAKAAK